MTFYIFYSCHVRLLCSNDVCIFDMTQTQTQTMAKSTTDNSINPLYVVMNENRQVLPNVHHRFHATGEFRLLVTFASNVNEQ